VVRARAVWTGDYLSDASFPHGDAGDSFVRRSGRHSVMAAPLIGEGGPFGAVTVFSRRTDAWGETDAQLLVAIADQAAITITTTRLIAELGESREALGRRAQAEQALREIAARITVLRDTSEILGDVVEQAVRLVRADGVILDLLDPATGHLRWALDSGVRELFSDEERSKLWIDIGVGATGTAVADDRVVLAFGNLEDQFPPSPESTEFYERTGFRSMIAAPITGEAGPLGVIEVYSKKLGAFTATDAGLIGALASQAAIAITNARLIDELGRSRAQLARTADAERTLREIAGRVSAMRDQGEILQSVIDASARLLQASGVTIDLIDGQGMAEAWLDPEVRARTEANLDLLDSVEIDPDVGVSGLAIRTRATARTGDYLEDRRFEHTPDRDAFVRESAIRSVLAAPLIHRDDVFGVINAYSDRVDAFDDTDADLLAALADQAAIAIANARLIEELQRSRTEIARRADSERTLREIAARVSAILEPDEVLQQITEEAARLLESDGARIDQYDPEIDALRWSYAAGDAMSKMPKWAKTGGLKPGQAVGGMAFKDRRAVLTTDYLTDERFDHSKEIDSFIKRMRIRAVMSTPLMGEDGPIGTISVVSRSPGHYDEADLEVLTALATQASVAIRNARLMDQLAKSRAVIERRAEAEHALREIAARITAIREPGDLLQHVVDEAQRLLRGDGAMIDQFDPETQTLEWAYDAGIPEAQRQAVKLTSLHLGEGVSGKAVAERRVVRVGDYLAAEDFIHDDLADSLATGAGLRDLIAAPIIGESGPLGAIEVFSRRTDAFDAIDEAVLGGLADQAAIAITNARLIEELEKSRRAVARRADTERSLRDITARIAALREPDVILDRVVEEAARLLGTDGAHLTRMSDDGTYLVPMVVAGGADFTTQAWLLGMRFPLGGGINGLAAQAGEPVSTFDYLVDPRIPHNPDDTEVADRLALRGMAAAPLRAPGGEVIGTLAVSSMEPRAFQPEELDLLQGLADQAAIAITNSTLLTRLASSEERYRYLVENAPDLVWSIDGEGRFTFLSDAVERLTGRSADAYLGKHFGALVHGSSREVAEYDFAAGMTTGSQELRGRVNIEGPDGEPVPAEFIASASLGEDGQFAGANGSVRDMRERDRLERGLRESETRFRQLVQTSPDVIYRCDADGRFLFIAEGVEALFGWTADEATGLTFADFTAEESLPEALANFEQQHGERDVVRRFRYMLRHRDGSTLPGEITSVSVWEDDVFAGVQGTVRGVGEQERLARELAASEERYRFLVENSPDVVFATDRDGMFTFLSEAIERLTGFTGPELTDRHFSTVVDPSTMGIAAARWEKLIADPTSEQVSELVLMGKDGRRTPVEVHALGIVADDGSFAGIHGSTRDISERERLQSELRTSEERYRYLVSSSPDLVWVTDTDGQLTFVSEAAESILGTPAAELIGRPYWDVFSESARREAEVRFKWLSRHPTSVHRSRLPFRHADGHDVLVEINGIGMVADGRFAGAHGAARDVSDRDRLERGLRQQAGELAAGEERAHLARELHDSVTQALFSMTLVSRSIEMLLDRDPDAARTQLTQLRELQREALAEMRALIFELRPGNLEQDGLVRAIKTHTASLQGRIGLPVVVESTLEERLPLAVEETLYRIAQEALHNVVKHAGAHEVRLEIRRTPNAVRLRITDDGKGFDPTKVPDGHLGLAGMRARAARIHGTFSCQSEIGKGTTVEVVVEDPEHAVPDARLGEMPSGSIRDR
jgi:PAS domain S-box-containing protein